VEIAGCIDDDPDAKAGYPVEPARGVTDTHAKASQGRGGGRGCNPESERDGDGDGEHLLVKLTSGGNIGLPVYSRSYAIRALAGLLRVVQPDSGLTYLGTVCAWPCVRGINGPNNGQVVRLADNAAIRFGEGGTGMSKMGSNAQTLLDMITLHHGLPDDAVLAPEAYRHTVVDRRRRVGRWLRKYGGAGKA